MAREDHLEVYDINDFLVEGQASENLTGEVRCAPSARDRIKLSLVGPREMPRHARLVLESPDFVGLIRLNLGPCDLDFSVKSAGRINCIVNAWRRSSISIGPRTTINNSRIVAHNSDIEIGADNLWSDDIILQSNDQHGIVDMVTRELIRTERKFVRTDDHVWIGRRAVLMPNSQVGYGSIVGACSLVSRAVPEFCVAAGSPAEPIRRDVTWSRSPDGFDAFEHATVEPRYEAHKLGRARPADSGILSLWQRAVGLLGPGR